MPDKILGIVLVDRIDSVGKHRVECTEAFCRVLYVDVVVCNITKYSEFCENAVDK